MLLLICKKKEINKKKQKNLKILFFEYKNYLYYI